MRTPPSHLFTKVTARSPSTLSIRAFRRGLCAAALIPFVVACGADVDAEHEVGAEALSTAEERAAVLNCVNDPEVGFDQLDVDAGLDRRAARNIIEVRNGDDGAAGTRDDELFRSIAALDAVPYVGEKALAQLLSYAEANGYMGGTPAPLAREASILKVVNAPEVTFAVLDGPVGLDRRAARAITDYRDGPDGRPGTSDDRSFTRLRQLDDLSYVGDQALSLLFAYAVENGYAVTTGSRSSAVVFSPQRYADSHNQRVVKVINNAERTLDIAMYSMSDRDISAALAAAIARGVSVRFLFETANDDRKAAMADRANTKSGRLEAMGVDVRWVNKIMHHKLLIADGPCHELAAADTATIVTGSGNWSWGAATRYDENTLFLTGYRELALRLQSEFDLLWMHSRDFDSGRNLAFELSTVDLSGDLESDPNTDVFFTSANFEPTGDTFRIKRGFNTVSDQLVNAILDAQSSIRVASGHLRSRPIAEALMAKKAMDPHVDIQVYLDGQEFISVDRHERQLTGLDECLVEAEDSVARTSDCYDKGFYFGYALDQAGIDVRYKHYSYRWHYSYAVQMHNKLMIIDDAELWTGSYNLSDNAEHNTFENMFVFRGAEHAGLVESYVTKFAELWETERDSATRQRLMERIASDSEIPLVYAPMALTWSEVDEIKSAIRTHCPEINSEALRSAPERHHTCRRR